ncbi:3-dehydroquinate synthase [Tessaracoccus bendigoensis DSM 12906]|uniref:3-dehydroquinate synthase n=1 Tax=Tessaracoccus bendigoensis DSM 12906 TaxID=1123357 RepID=A0A1M6MME4_9ACTN|nr:3-dehydroquinate synthase [Tessaracoccus bendigoensis]SHJ84584.1 3-dehydroquinate synthase [Tessaracoccus bendigoensis DSM 12906]
MKGGTVRVESKQGPYDVTVGRGALDRLPDLLGEASRVAVIHPASLGALARRVEAMVDRPVTLIPVPDAEAAKTPQVLTGCWNALAAAGFTRNDLVVGVGGGTTTDLAGFVAASWLRGIGYLSVPTSVLGMVDAAVGGKTGINLEAGKNLVGAFYEPRAVLCDLTLLASLDASEVASGLAEVIKCGFIADPEILKLATADLADCRDVASDRFAELVLRAVSVKARVVAADFTESTSVGDQVGREALNYGHTLGHAIEKHAGFTWRHGQAISVGMAWMARVSRDLLGLDGDTVELHDHLLGGLGLPLSYPAPFEELRPIMSLDKKARGASLRLIGMREIGRPTVLSEPPEPVLAAAFGELADR